MNNALSQNWVGCTVRTPKTQVAHNQRRSRAYRACTGRDTPRQPTPGRDLKTPGRDTKLIQPLPRPGRDAKSRSRPSWRLPYVATSISCRDIVSAHSGLSRSRHQKSMSRPQVAPQSFQHCRNLKIPGCNPLKTNPGRDLKLMSLPQIVHPKSQHGFSCHDQGLLTPNLS